MTYINLPNLNNSNLDFNIIYKNNKISNLFENEKDDVVICHSLYHYLMILKQSIDIYPDFWDIIKKITNPYEYIHTIVPNHKYSLCKYKPLSRSFFKMIEIIDTFNFLNEKNSIKSFHLAEGPGGFIEAFNYRRNNKEDIYYGMTLISDNINIPSWKKASQLLNNNKNIKLEYGNSKNGDLFLKENLLYCYKKYNNSINYITGDGGFDFSVDFNNQEEISFKLILSQIFFALVMQKEGGHFVLKIFDIFKIKTIEIIYLLCNLYENVFIFKPNTSRAANSEKYIICRNYKNNNKKIITNIIDNFDLLINNIGNIYSLFNIKMNKLFITKLQEINAIYGQQQLENISNTINFIREFKAINVECNLINNNDYSSFLKYLNIFNKNILHNIDEIIMETTNKKYNNEIIIQKDDNNNESTKQIFKINVDKHNSKYNINNKNINKDIDKEPNMTNKIIDTSYNEDNFIMENFSDDNSDQESSYNNKIQSSPKLTYIKYINNIEEKLNLDLNLLDLSFISDEPSLNKKEENIIINNKNENKNTIVNNKNSVINKYFNKLNILVNINIQKSINWCKKHQFTINKEFIIK